MNDILQKIVAVKHEEIAAARKKKPLELVRQDAESRLLTRDFEGALRAKIAGGQAAVIAEIAVIIFAGFLLIYGGFMLVSETLKSGQVTPAMGWKVGYLYSVVPLSGLFIVAFSIEHLVSGRTTSSADEVGKEIL